MIDYDASEVVAIRLMIELLSEIAERLQNQVVTVKLTIDLLSEVMESLQDEDDRTALNLIRIIRHQLATLETDLEDNLYSRNCCKSSMIQKNHPSSSDN